MHGHTLGVSIAHQAQTFSGTRKYITLPGPLT